MAFGPLEVFPLHNLTDQPLFVRIDDTGCQFCGDNCECISSIFLPLLTFLFRHYPRVQFTDLIGEHVQFSLLLLGRIRVVPATPSGRSVLI